MKPLSRISAFCEGKTEKVYLETFAAHVGRKLVEVEFVPEVGVPSTVVARCIQRKIELDLAAKRRGADSFDKNFSVWAVFDRDDHDCYYRAIAEARDHGINVAYSNPCCELWALLHLMSYGDRNIHRSELQSMLRSRMPLYDHNRSPLFTFSLMQNEREYELARGQAIRLLENRNEFDDQFGCPATSIYQLTDKILDSARTPTDRKQKAKDIERRIMEIDGDPLYLQGDPGLARERSGLYTRLRNID